MRTRKGQFRNQIAIPKGDVVCRHTDCQHIFSGDLPKCPKCRRENVDPRLAMIKSWKDARPEEVKEQENKTLRALKAKTAKALAAKAAKAAQGQ